MYCDFERIEKGIRCKRCGIFYAGHKPEEPLPIHQTCTIKPKVQPKVAAPLPKSKMGSPKKLTPEEIAEGEKLLLKQIDYYKEFYKDLPSDDDIQHRLAVCRACPLYEGNRCPKYCIGCQGNAAPQFAKAILSLSLFPDKEPPPIPCDQWASGVTVPVLKKPIGRLIKKLVVEPEKIRLPFSAAPAYPACRL